MSRRHICDTTFAPSPPRPFARVNGDVPVRHFNLLRDDLRCLANSLSGKERRTDTDDGITNDCNWYTMHLKTLAELASNSTGEELRHYLSEILSLSMSVITSHTNRSRTAAWMAQVIINNYMSKFMALFPPDMDKEGKPVICKDDDDDEEDGDIIYPHPN